ncbi:MAG TPA: PEP-CTERM/exosortase system-associated acyltransferase [Bryobacteraceae bacterium]|nr:PEP-CTERM/exosortase system-associated acyltransferase [Bryobacteraceae bacterium]
MALDMKEAEVYNRYFSITLADTSYLLEQVYRLRYQVYCVEHPFENPNDHFIGLETDEYDSHSVHAAIVHRSSGMVCGCVRLILPRPGASLPITEFVSAHTRAGLPPTLTAEVSRYAVSKAFRRRAGESEYPDVHFGDLGPSELKRLMPHITLGLLLAVATLSVKYGITHLTAVMAPALLRLLRTCGMEFQSIGPFIEHHGTRQPCSASVADLLDGVKVKNPGYFDIIRSGLNAVCGNPVHIAASKTHCNWAFHPQSFRSCPDDHIATTNTLVMEI